VEQVGSAPPTAGRQSVATEVGDRVTAVLAAAEQAADELRADARAESERLVREAEERAQQRVEEIAGEPERLLAEAEQSAADLQARAHEEATRIVAAAEARAAELEQASAERIREEERVGRETQAQIRNETEALTRDRGQVVAGLDQTLRSLQRVSGQLETTIVGASVSPPQGWRDRLLGSRPAPATVAEAPEQPTVYEDLKEQVNGDSDGDGGANRAELMRRAKGLGIEGRAKMSTAELEAEIRERE
jgi:cell division septum initiation protein DivIVA